MKNMKGTATLIAGLVLGLAALTAACFIWFKKRKKGYCTESSCSRPAGPSKKDHETPCCTLEDVNPPTESLGE